MKLSTMLLSSFLAASVTATSLPPSSCKVAKFDDLEVAALPLPLPLLTPVPNYQGLSFPGWVLVTQATTLNGLLPHSPKKDIAATMATDLLFLQSLTLNPFGNITLDPSLTSGKSFSLKSFWFGCILDLHNGAVAAAEGCAITVVGFDSKGNQVTSQPFNFAPSGSGLKPIVSAQMVIANLPPTFTDLTSVTFGVAVADGLASQASLRIDDVGYCISA